MRVVGDLGEIPQYPLLFSSKARLEGGVGRAGAGVLGLSLVLVCWLSLVLVCWLS